MSNSVSCVRCGAEAFASLDAEGGSGWYGSERYDFSTFVLLRQGVQLGPICDACGEGAEKAGEFAVATTLSGLVAPSELGYEGAVALFWRGYIRAQKASQKPWQAGLTKSVTARVGVGYATDCTVGEVPLPAWMGAVGDLWRPFSGQMATAGNQADFKSLGALYYLLTSGSATRLEVGEAARESFLREVVLERQVRDVKKRHKEIASDISRYMGVIEMTAQDDLDPDGC